MTKIGRLLLQIESLSKPVVKELYRKYSNASQLIDAATEAGLSIAKATDTQEVVDAAKKVNVRAVLA